jgi:uncharacterized delta-60 repeat protein
VAIALALALALALVLAMTPALAAGAAPAAAALPAGFPDTSFGVGGMAQAPYGSAGRAAALALGPGGSITVAGDVRGSAGEAALVARFTSTGVLDTAFAGTGSRLDRFGANVGSGSEQRANAVAVAPDGATIVAGVAGRQIMVARYLPNGELDGLFGAGGVVLRDLSGGGDMPAGGGLAANALTPSGQIVVAGSVGVPPGNTYEEGEPGERVVVGRLSDRGVPDSTFGAGGFVTLQLGARSARRPARSRVAALALGSDGTILLAGGSSGPDGADRGVVARLTPAGRPDTGFASAGRRVLQLGLRSAARTASSSLHALAPRSDGTLLVAGHGSDVAGSAQVVLARLTATGSLDPGYGRHGIVRTQVGAATKQRAAQSVARAIAATADGNVLVTGSDAEGDAFSLRTTTSGRLDCAYGSLGQAGGLHTSTPGHPGDPADNGAFGVVAQADGNYVAAGRRVGGGLLLGRVLGGPGPGAQTAPRRPGLRTLGARYLGQGRAVVYGAVLASCSAATVRFVVAPRGGGRAVTTRYVRVSGAYGPQIVCATLRGLRPGRTYRVRIDARQTRGPVGGVRALRAVPTGRRTLPQEGCA